MAESGKGRRRTRPGRTRPDDAVTPREISAIHIKKQRFNDKKHKVFKGTVLLVDDDDLVRGSMRMSLQGDYRIHEASDGFQGLDVLEKKLSEIDCVVTDIRMPGLNGSEYMARAAKVTKEVYFIVVTGHKGEVTESKLIGDGGGRLSGFLEKPVTSEELKYQIDKAIELTRNQRDRLRANMNAHKLVTTVENIYSIKNLEHLLAAIFENVALFSSVRTGFLAFSDDGSDHLVVRGGVGRFEGMIGEPVVGNPKLRCHEVDLLLECVKADRVKDTEEVMILPLKRGGLLLIGQPFVDPRDKDFIRTYARNAEKAIENVVYYEQLEEKKRLEQELKIASRIQTSLLPKEIPQLTDIEVCGFQIPAREVGGDYYDFIDMGGENLCICIGDVSGKGLPAGLVMVMARSYLQILMSKEGDGDIRKVDSLASILNKINHILHKDTESTRFMTMLLSYWDAEEKILHYTGAGHERLIVYRKATGKCELLKPGGVMLGMLDEVEGFFRDRYLELESGDTVVLYTDGVTEARSLDNKLYGMDLLLAAVENYSTSGSVSTLIESVGRDLDKFMHGQEQYDDITLVALRRK